MRHTWEQRLFRRPQLTSLLRELVESRTGRNERVGSLISITIDNDSIELTCIIANEAVEQALERSDNFVGHLAVRDSYLRELHAGKVNIVSDTIYIAGGRILNKTCGIDIISSTIKSIEFDHFLDVVSSDSHEDHAKEREPARTVIGITDEHATTIRFGTFEKERSGVSAILRDLIETDFSGFSTDLVVKIYATIDLGHTGNSLLGGSLCRSLNRSRDSLFINCEMRL